MFSEDSEIRFVIYDTDWQCYRYDVYSGRFSTIIAGYRKYETWKKNTEERQVFDTLYVFGLNYVFIEMQIKQIIPVKCTVVFYFYSSSLHFSDIFVFLNLTRRKTMTHYRYKYLSRYDYTALSVLVQQFKERKFVRTNYIYNNDSV